MPLIASTLQDYDNGRMSLMDFSDPSQVRHSSITRELNELLPSVIIKRLIESDGLKPETI